ncbi:acyl-CoA dehydrogenase family protein [Sphingobium ummariense]
MTILAKEERNAVSKIGDSFEHLRAAAEALVPEIRKRARHMNENGRLDDDLIDEMEKAGLLSIMVPKKWGGAGLGLHETHKIIEIIASGDCSTAWVASFFMVHAVLLCRYPVSTQERMFKDRSMVRVAAVWAPPGKAEKVDGGYRVTGKWGYASGIYHADAVLVPVIIDGQPNWGILSPTDVKVHGDWDMAAMAATGSATISATDAFIADDAIMPVTKIVSAEQHYGTIHPETVYKLPFTALLMMTPSISVGGLSHALELAREKLTTSKPYGVARIDRIPARMRWAEAYEELRIITLLRDAAGEDALRRGSAVPLEALEEEAAVGLDSIAIVHNASRAARKLLDGLGSSIYKASEAMPRIAGDLACISTHVLGYDYDVMMERNARWILGMGLGEGDATTRL